MIGFILTGHGHFSTGLKSALDMIAGPQEAFEVVTFTEEEAGAYGDTLRAAVKDMREKTDGVLIFCDLMGGTPFNQSMMITAEQDNISVVADAHRHRHGPHARVNDRGPRGRGRRGRQGGRLPHGARRRRG